jgi:hypothetical protein
MTFERFSNTIQYLKAQQERVRALYENRIDVIDFTNDYELVITELLKEIYGEEGYDWFSWFCYETDFGEKMSKEEPRAWDKDENPICYDLKSLWEHLEGL